MLPYESIGDMFSRFIILINGLKNLGKVYTNEEMIEKEIGRAHV